MTTRITSSLSWRLGGVWGWPLEMAWLFSVGPATHPPGARHLVGSPQPPHAQPPPRSQGMLILSSSEGKRRAGGCTGGTGANGGGQKLGVEWPPKKPSESREGRVGRVCWPPRPLLPEDAAFLHDPLTSGGPETSLRPGGSAICVEGRLPPSSNHF